MNCPTCGLQTLSDQSFCRSCGATLQMTVPARAGNSVARWGIIVMFIGVVLGIIGTMILHVDAVTIIGVLMSVAGMFLVMYPFLRPAARLKIDSAGTTSQLEIPARPQPTMQLPPVNLIDFVPSVTERTTNLLKVPVAANRIDAGE